MQKKQYTAPEMTTFGTVEELTAGEGLRGNHDSISFWFVTISWGQEPDGS